MKEIIAIIRMEKMNAVKEALSEAGLPSFTARKVLGRGRGKVEYFLRGGDQPSDESLDSMSPGPKLIPKRMLTIAVPDAMVEKTVKTLISVNSTGRPGDGKIFVLPMLDACRVRTGERGDLALDEQSAVPAEA